MTYNPEDPRLTMYALGEMPEDERSEFEAGLDDTDRAEVQAIRETAALLRQELAAEPAPTLTDSQRVRIEDAAALPRRRPFRRLTWLAAAACFALLVGILTWPAVRDRLRVAKQQLEEALPSQADADGDGRALERERIVSDSALQDLDESISSGTRRKAGGVEQAKKERREDKVAEVAAEVALPATQPVLTFSEAKAVKDDLAQAVAAKAPDAKAATGGEMGGGMGIPVGGMAMGGMGGGMGGMGPAAAAPAAKPKAMSVIVYDGATRLGRPPAPAEAPAPAPRRASSDMFYSTATLGGPATEAEAKPEGLAREAYDRVRDNPFTLVRQDPLSTFSIDVDTASYANVRRFLTQNQLPPPDAVRIEELVNYFSYDYEQPKGERPFSVSVDLAQCPWSPQHRLARVALKGREPDLAHRPASNLVFLLDVSGSMRQPNKLPLVKETMRMLVDNLGENDRVAIAVYAGASGMVLPSTSCDRKQDVLAALDRLQAGGSTNGGAGIQLAYQTAVENFIKGGTNRVILATDGDFNVGISDRGQLTRLIEEKAKSGVFLTVLGFGNGNLQDAMLEEISGKGNGTYAYIDSVREARKVMVEQIGGTLLTIAKDVKIQVEFNPGRISAYRLVGYENRILRHQDFNDDTKDAGEIGAGLTVTAFYELVPRGVKIDIPGVDPLKYQTTALADEAVSEEALTVKLRYKLPDSDTSTLIQEAVKDRPRSMRDMSDDYVFATSVAAFGMVLRDSPYKGSASLLLAEELARTGARRDPQGYRKEFLELIRKAKELKR